LESRERKKRKKEEKKGKEEEEKGNLCSYDVTSPCDALDQIVATQLICICSPLTDHKIKKTTTNSTG